MALPREPRQKMINMMYLVLTALLALNVSSEILNAFKTVNRSLETTNVTVGNSTTTIMKSLEEKTKKSETADRANFWYPKAQQAQQFSKDVYSYIQGIKNNILTEAGGDPNNPDKNFKEDNLDISTRLMVEKGEGKILFQKLSEYKENILKKIHPSIDSAFATTLPIDLSTPKTKNKGNNSWEAVYFRMVPTVAALTILSKFQNDVKTTENRVIQFCHNKVGEVEVVFDSYAAIVGQNSNYLMPGQEIQITAGIGAFSKAAKPTISIGGTNAVIGDNGYAEYKGQAGAIGQHTVPITIKYFNQISGKEETVTRDVTYTVGQANASIALDKMNVLYIGVDNPLTIAASGGGDDKVRATISQGNLTSLGRGKYIARVNKVDDNTVVTVSVDGKVAGASQFRVRTIPDAQAYVGGQPSGTEMSAGAFKAQAGVGAGIKNFPFQLEYDVVSFTFTCDTDDDIISVPSSGGLFQGAVRRAVDQHVKAGRMVTIENIRVKGPDGRVTSVPALFYYIK
ncbi:MAG TPA: gliding motility protein GldM [Chitinophagaceae bacterium]|nr:gliding motility protein GldM [Chitinophagaceae bacterium]